MINRQTLIIVITLFLNCQIHAQSDTLSILSWNVFLRPAILSDGQNQRVDNISQFILDKNCDIVVLQEVFHQKSRKSLLKFLKNKYPHATKMGNTSFFGISSGVVILSKYPIKKSHFKYFKKATGSDALAKKAVVKSRVQIDSFYVDIYGTHMQAGQGEKRRKIRQKQLDIIEEFINQEDTIVDIIAGDFNIHSTTPSIDSVLIKLDTELPKLTGELRKTANFSDHDLMTVSGEEKWIDYIFLRNTPRANIIETRIYEAKYDDQEIGVRFSDHNAVVSKIVLY